MERKFIFFDIDGTLAMNEMVSDSTIQTIQKLKENGHIVGIATGRQISTTLPFSKLLGIDYIVSDGGYGITIQNKTIHIDPLEDEIAIPLCNELFKKHIPFALTLDPNALDVYATSKMNQNDPKGDYEGFKIIIDETLDYHAVPIYKVFMRIGSGDEKLIESFDLTRINRYEEDWLVVEPDDKYKGILEIVQYFQGNNEDIIYFGDGYNDLAVFDHVRVSIAMENGIEELKQKASFVTKSVEEDGIAYACKVLKLI